MVAPPPTPQGVCALTSRIAPTLPMVAPLLRTVSSCLLDAKRVAVAGGANGAVTIGALDAQIR